MGYLDKILNKRNQQKKISGDKKKEIYIDKQGREIFNNSFKSIEKGYTITIFGIEEQGLKAKHRNGQITKLMLAKAIKVRDGDALIVDLADDIAFELKEGQQPDGNVLQAVAYEYEKRNAIKNKTCDYLGIVDYTDKGYEITQKSQKVEQYVTQKVVPEILEKRRAREELLANAEKYSNREGLSYIGGIDRNGKLNHSAEPDSLGIANAIKRLTQEYAKNNGKTR